MQAFHSHHGSIRNPLAEAKQRGLEVNPVNRAPTSDKLVGELYQTPPAIIAEVRAMVSEGAR